ncbi:MAG: nuclease-related domain-containing protein [bacterium]
MAENKEENLPPRVFKPKKNTKEKKDSEFLDGWIRAEFIVGGALLAMGGFVLRSTNRYDLLILGGGLLIIAFIRLYFRFRAEEKVKQRNRDMDRILFRLREQLTPEYSIACSYPVKDNLRIDYLVVGPGGLFVVQRLEQRGYIEGKPEDEVWIQKSEKNSDSKNKMDNPIILNKEKIIHLKNILKELPPPYPSIKPENCVTFTYHQVEGPVLDYPEIQLMNTLGRHIRNCEQPAPLNWEEIKDLEDYLNFDSYT